MTLKEVREKAKALQIRNLTRLGRDDLVPAIQVAEGNTDCWKKIAGCGQEDCCWRTDCQEETASRL